jgi:23S rRNA pseudouridine2605 synthase
VGYLSAASDPEGRPLVYHLMPKGLALRSIGRLDFNTEGVLLFTNDGDLAERLGHARYNVQRVYEARVRGIPSEDTLAKLRMGVRLEDGPARAEQVEIVKQTDNNAWLRLTLTEGRNREVRRLLERVGHPVVRLRRVSFAGVTTLGCKLGEYRTLDEVQVAQLIARGHVGTFDLPPDPRKRREAPAGLSTGPTPEREPPRRGEGRSEVVERRAPAPKPAAPASPAKPAPGPRSRRSRELDLPVPSSGGRPRRSDGPGRKPAAPGGRPAGKPGSNRRPSGPPKGR